MSPTDDAHLTADEDIIELTDIIEKGSASKASPESDAASFEKELEDLFSDGGGLESLKGFESLDADIPPPAPAGPAVSPPGDGMDAGMDASPDASPDASMDADIDALLNSIGDLPDTPEPAPRPAPAVAPHNDAEEATSMSAKPVSSTPSAITGRPVDPDEELRMPDMTDVDALLGDLGAPSAADLTSGGAGRTMGDDDIDDLIAGLDAKAPPAPPAAPAAPASAEQAAPQKPADMVDVADLDALLEDMLGSGPKGAAPAPESAPAAEELDPFEAALAASAAQPSVAPPDEPPADGDPFEAALAAAATAAAIAAPESPRPAPKAAPVAAEAPGESPDISMTAPAPDAEDTPAGYAARIEALEASLAALAERNDEERAAREALETRVSAMESLADDAPALSEDGLAALLEPLLAREDDPFAPLVERVRAALAEELDTRIEEQLAPLRERVDAAQQGEGVTRADLDMMAADLRAALLAETDKAAASAAARIIREEIAALAEAL